MKYPWKRWKIQVKGMWPIWRFLQNKVSNNSETKVKCKYFSKGFCKRGSSCDYLHSNLDCKDHMDHGTCYISNCPDWHREDCKFFKSRKGCERKSSCAYLHRASQVTTEKDDKESTDEEKIKELEESIAEMTNVIKKKDAEINMSKKDIQKLRNQP